MTRALHHLKKSIILGIRTAIISFRVLLTFNMTVLKKDSLTNFIIVAMLVSLCSFILGITVFLNKYSKHMKHLKNIAVLMVMISFIVVGYIEFPFISSITYNSKEISTDNYTNTSDIHKRILMDYQNISKSADNQNKDIWISIG